MIRKSLKDISELASKVSETAMDAASVVSNAASGTVNAVGDAANAASKAVTDTAMLAAMHSEHAVSSTYNGAIDTVDAAVATAKGVGRGVTNVLPVAYCGGIAISMVVAPVPTLIGVLALELMCAAFQDGVLRESEKVKRVIDQRDVEYKIGMLERYGKLPRNSIVENEYVRLEIDIIEKTTKGEIKTGKYRGRALESLSENELRCAHEDASHELTRRMIAAYFGCRFPKSQI